MGPAEARSSYCLMPMRSLAALSLVVALILMTPSASARSTKVRGPFLLISLPAIGTITWRCDRSKQPSPALAFRGVALGFRAFVASATVHLRLHVRTRTIVARVVQPGESVRLPYLRSRVQQLDFIQKTGAGTLRAFVTVNFVWPATSTYCYSYLPPQIDVRVLPRA